MAVLLFAFTEAEHSAVSGYEKSPIPHVRALPALRLTLFMGLSVSKSPRNHIPHHPRGISRQRVTHSVPHDAGAADTALWPRGAAPPQ